MYLILILFSPGMFGRDFPSSLANNAARVRAIQIRNNQEMIYQRVFDRIHLAAVVKNSSDFTCFVPNSSLCIDLEKESTYKNFCNDFGPMNLGMVYRFCSMVEKGLEESDDLPIVIVSLADRKSLTNAVFLLGAYMIMCMHHSIETILAKLRPLIPKIGTYRDVSPGDSNFDLRVQDCWAGLLRAKRLYWVDFTPGPTCFDDEKYAHYENPLNADLHELVPGKFVALPSPEVIEGTSAFCDEHYADGCLRRRVFSPAYCADILCALGVEAVVRLDPLHYNRRVAKSGDHAIIQFH